MIKNTVLLGKILIFILIIGSSFGVVSTIGLQPNHEDHPQEDHELPSMSIDDQPMVDGKIAVHLTYNYTAVVIVENNQQIVGHGAFQMPSSGPGHHGIQLNQMSMIPTEGLTMWVHVKIMDNVDVVGKSLTATLYKDVGGDGQVNGTDSIVTDNNNNPLVYSFKITDDFPTSMDVKDQEIDPDNPYVIIDRSVVPGPAWQVIHGYDKGALGPQYGIKETLRHGINKDIRVSFTEEDLNNMGLEEDGDSVKVFAHLHYDTFDTGNYNSSTDPHIYSPAFDDEILGNDSAVLFTITVSEGFGRLPISYLWFGISLVAIVIFRKKS